MRVSRVLILTSILLSVSGWDTQSWASNTQDQSKSQPGKSTGLQADEIEIDRVDINGVKVFSATEIENTLEIGPGDKLERLKVLRTEENLQALYVRHGYEEVGIRSRLVRKRNPNKALETVLEFTISEGLPVRIGSIRFVLLGAEKDERIKKVWVEREKQLTSGLLFSVGDIYNQDKINETKRSLQETLASAEYIGVKVDEVRTPEKSPPDLVEKGLKDIPVSKWVNLEFQVDLGDRVSFGFRGNTAFTQGYLDALVQDQRVLGLGRDYVGVIRSKLEEEYHSLGYSQVEITPYTFELPGKYERKVTYAIREGPRVKIDSINFDGNSVFTSEQLRKRFFDKSSPLIQSGFYFDKDIQKSADLLVEWMKEQGYLSARVVTTNISYPAKPRTQQQNSSVKILIYLYEGDQTLIDKVSVEGSTVLKVSDISRILQVRSGSPLNLFAFGDGIENLKKAYRDRGYLNFKILNEGTESLIRYTQENHLANISIQVDEGPEFRISRIEIEGTATTDRKVVLREIRFKEGEVLKESDLIQTERQIRRLGVFSAVVVKPVDDPMRNGYKIIRISLKEADRGSLVYGPGYRNDLGIRLFGQLSYANLWGENHTVSLSASANRRFYNYHFAEGQAQLAYSWPWFGLPELNFRPTATIGRTQYINFNADTMMLAANWERQLLSSPNVTGYFSYTFENILQSGAVEAIDNGAFQIATITPKVSLDLRDSPLAPTSGYFGMIWLDLALPFFGSQYGSQGNSSPIAYYRAQFRSDYYWAVTRGIIWYFSFRTGYEQTINVDPANPSFIPLIKEFAVGGIASIRGYQEQQFYNPYSLTNGSLAYVNYRTQVDFPFAGPLKFGVFLDAGNLLVNNFSFGGLNYGTGFGFHYQTPVGPINFDWGFAVDPPPGASPYVINFSVGII